MDNQKFRILLSGRLIDGFERADVESALSQLLKLPLEQVQRLLGGERSRLRKSFDLAKAEHLKEKLISRGIDCTVEPVLAKAPPAKVESDNTNPLESAIDQQTKKQNDQDAGLDIPTASRFGEGHSLELDLPAAPELAINDSATLDDLDLDLPDDLAGDANASLDEVVLGGEPESDRVVSVDEIAPPVRSNPRQSQSDDTEDSGHEQFFEQPNIIHNNKPDTADAGKKRLVVYGLAVSLLLVSGLWFVLPMLSDEPAVVSENRPVAQQPQLPQDPKRATSEKRLRVLSRSVRVWMIQFGSGFDPAQVTLARLQQDLEITPLEMLDGWGTAFRYHPGEGAYRVISAGKDRQFDTVDDLVDKVKIQ